MSARMPDGRLDLLRQRLPSCVDEEWKREVLAELDRARSTEERLRTMLPGCANCDRPAECFGCYEGAEGADYACSECCGHGNEDGWCVPLSGIPANVSAWMKRGREDEQRADAAESCLREFVEMQDEVDKYPTSDAHPVFAARRILGMGPAEEES